MGEPSNLSTAAMNSRVRRGQYLVTFSQANESEFSTRERFGKMLQAEFNACTNVVKVDYWACSREEDQNDGFHYHCELKLACCKKWLPVKNRFAEKPGIQVNVSDKPPAKAFDSCLSKNQKVNCRISCCLCHKKEVHKRRIFLCCCREAQKFDQPGFSSIRERGIRSYTELLAIAEERRTAGQMDIAEFVFKRNEKILCELVTKTWQRNQPKKN